MIRLFFIKPANGRRVNRGSTYVIDFFTTYQDPSVKNINEPASSVNRFGSNEWFHRSSGGNLVNNKTAVASPVEHEDSEGVKDFKSPHTDEVYQKSGFNKTRSSYREEKNPVFDHHHSSM